MTPLAFPDARRRRPGRSQHRLRMRNTLAVGIRERVSHIHRVLRKRTVVREVEQCRIRQRSGRSRRRWRQRVVIEERPVHSVVRIHHLVLAQLVRAGRAVAGEQIAANRKGRRRVLHTGRLKIQPPPLSAAVVIVASDKIHRVAAHRVRLERRAIEAGIQRDRTRCGSGQEGTTCQSDKKTWFHAFHAPCSVVTLNPTGHSIKPQSRTVFFATRNPPSRQHKKVRQLTVPERRFVDPIQHRRLPAFGRIAHHKRRSRSACRWCRILCATRVVGRVDDSVAVEIARQGRVRIDQYGQRRAVPWTSVSRMLPGL